MKILVTGGAGFMGSNFIRYILNSYRGYEVVNLDKLTYAGNLDNLADIECDFGGRYRFIKGDIAKREDVDKAAHNVDVIINYAAESHVDKSIMDPTAFLYTDVIGTFNLLEYVRLNHIPSFIQISTDEVFGSVPDGEFHEASPFEPNSPYAASKAGGDLLCRAYRQTYESPVIVTHSCNFYGPFQYPEKILPLFITNLIEGKKIPLYGRDDQIREWIFTEDHCRAIDYIMHHGCKGEVYNIGTGTRYTNLDLTRLLLAMLGKDESSIEYVGDRPGHDRRYAINTSKLNVLGWKAIMPFEEGLRKTVDWYTSNVAWWKKIRSGEFKDYYKKQYGGAV